MCGVLELEGPTMDHGGRGRVAVVLYGLREEGLGERRHAGGAWGSRGRDIARLPAAVSGGRVAAALSAVGGQVLVFGRAVVGRGVPGVCHVAGKDGSALAHGVASKAVDPVQGESAAGSSGGRGVGGRCRALWTLTDCQPHSRGLGAEDDRDNVVVGEKCGVLSVHSHYHLLLLQTCSLSWTTYSKKI